MTAIHYETLVDAIQDLQKRGYLLDFNSQKQDLCDSDAFIVDEYHRFEGLTDPADSSILFAIRSSNGDKGIYVDAFGTCASSNFIQSLPGFGKPALW